jgi:ankyrin repeat protein
METIIDGILMNLAITSHASHVIEPTDFLPVAQLFEKTTAYLVDEFVEDREFSILHQVLLGTEKRFGTLEEYLYSLESHSPLPADVIDVPDGCGRTPLVWAVEYGWDDAVKTLLRWGANPRQTRPSLRGELPLLHLVIACPSSESSNQDYVKVVRSLLAAGADINGVDHEGWTPLHVAASWNNARVIKELAGFAGYDLEWNALTKEGESAMDLAEGGGIDDEVRVLLHAHMAQKQDTEVDTEDISSSDSEPEEFVDCVSVPAERR